MSGVFGDGFAALYDALYAGKDYPGECDVIEGILRRWSAPVATVLDLGCGTGRHSVLLAERGYRVHGLDRSPAMLERAAANASRLPPETRPVFSQGDVRDFDLGRRFDAVVMMFAVMSYQLTDEDLDNALAAAHRHLAPGGLLIFDAWYGPAMLASRPGDRVAVTEQDGREIVRASRTSVDALAHRACVDFRVWDIGQSVARFEERHEVRFFFPLELKYHLARAGFETVCLGDMPNWERPPNVEKRDFIVVGRAHG